MTKSNKNLSYSTSAILLALAIFGYSGPTPLGPVGQAWAKSPDFSKVFADIARNRTEAVVNISAKMKPKSSKGEKQLREFFGRNFPAPPKRERQSLGSGFIVEKDGFILTNSHVVSGADEIIVTMGNGSGGNKGKEYKAKIVTIDPKLDVALLKIEPEGDLKTLNMGDSKLLEVGDWVMAIGNPFGLSQSVTVGVVSAKGRIIGAGDYDDFIQTDAAINQGNSGGPLLDYHGNVVGINTAIFTGGGMNSGNIGIGFAIPINAVKKIYNDMKKGHIRRGWLGVRLLGVNKEIAKKLGLDSEAGALIETVKKGSPADKAGFLPFDVILEFDGTHVPSHMALPKIVATHKPGSRVRVIIFRDGKKKTLTVTLGEFADSKAEAANTDEAGTKKEEKISMGMTIEKLTSKWTKRLELDRSVKGVVVTEVDPRSPAAAGGIRPGDVIISIERKKIRSITEYEKAIESAEPDSTLLVMVVRNGDTTIAMLKVPKE
ncbi:MAG: Do family serine endopeptidase [Nitrospinota bacterium]|nr:Do family serine endopeptidase [Nitrospinota bacterium]